jgi:hypothetical protein
VIKEEFAITHDSLWVGGLVSALRDDISIATSRDMKRAARMTPLAKLPNSAEDIALSTSRTKI